MAPKTELQSFNSMEMSLSTATAHLRYERSAGAIELLGIVEEMRKMRFRNALLGDEVADLNEQLFDEAERRDEAELDAQTWQVNAEEATERLDRAVNELRFVKRELENLKTELVSLQNVSADSTKLLTEKLALLREISNLKPELEHLRSQASANQTVLAEKLSLQRQLSTVQVELDNEKRTLQRVISKQGKSGEQNSHYEGQIDELKRALSKERRERENAERVASKVSEEQVDELKKELAGEKRDREKAEKAANKASEEQLDDLRKELAREKREREKLENSAGKAGDERIEEVKKDLVREKRDRQQAEKDARRADAEWKTQRAVLDDKLDQFRSKLRSTKEKLKDTETELHKVQAATVTRPSAAESKPKNPRKRAVAQVDPDAAIGTPGNEGPAKRGKRASSVVGEKSTFSITPFLNRTTSVAPSSPPRDAEPEDEEEEPVLSIETAASPSAKRGKTGLSSKKVTPALIPTSDSKKNARNGAVGRKKAAASLTLEKVAEECEAVEEEAENRPPISATANEKAMASKPTLKPKSLNSFASFRDASLPPQQKKKRKLLGGVGKTLFDEDDDADAVALGAGRGGFGGQRAFGVFAARGFGSISLLGAKKIVVAEDGFAFSPLKKDRKAMALAAAAK